ncbi:MAG: SLC13 family permease, partial [Chloroflexota bacterium]
MAALVAAVLFFILGWWGPVPEGLSRQGQVGLCTIAASLPLLVMQVMPNYAVAVLLAALLVVPGVVTPSVALAGMGSSSWLMILTLLAISASLSGSGLLFRLALLAAERLPPNFLIQSLALSGLGVVLGTGVSTGSARVALAAPAARELATALRYGKQSPASAALGLSAFVGFTELGTLFVTGSPVCLLLLSMIPEVMAGQVTWGFWFVAALLPNLLFFAFSFLVIMFTLRPPLGGKTDLGTVALQRRLLGPVTRREIISITLLLLLVAGFATARYHGVNAAWIAVAVFLALVVTKTLDTPTFERGVNWGLMIY